MSLSILGVTSQPFCEATSMPAAYSGRMRLLLRCAVCLHFVAEAFEGTVVAQAAGLDHELRT